MIFRVFCVLDAVVACLIVLAHLTGWSHWLVLLYAAAYLLFKTALYLDNWMSWVDAAVAGWVLLLAAGVSGVVSWFAAAWLLYKASFFAAS